MLIERKKLKGRIIYIKGHRASEKQARESYNSFIANGFNNIELHQGTTPDKLKKDKIPFKILKEGRLESFRKKNYKKFLTKLSCVYNHINFCHWVIEQNYAGIFSEHDSVCVKSFDKIEVQDFCFLNFDTAFTRPCFNKKKFQKYKPTSKLGINSFPNDYPLKCKYSSIFKGSIMPPGTAGYILTPSGAQKILNSVYLHGLEQSDFLINSYVLKLEYIYPSICEYNPVNLQTSHGL